MRAATSALAPDGTIPTARESEYFYAGFVRVSGTTEQGGRPARSEAEFDRDFDHFPDAMPWQAANDAARARYQTQAELLDCVDRDPAPVSRRWPCPTTRCRSIRWPSQVWPGLRHRLRRQAADVRRQRWRRRHRKPRLRRRRRRVVSPATRDRATAVSAPTARAAPPTTASSRIFSRCQPARCDSDFDFNCTGTVTPCFVDDDCDGYSPNDPVASLRDCDDTNALVHPGAAKTAPTPAKTGPVMVPPGRLCRL